VLLGNNIPPFSYADGLSDRLADFTNYYVPCLGTGQIIPQLFTNSTQGRLRGSCPLGVAPYTNIVIDVYLADEEAWTNGQQFQLAELMYYDPVTATPQYYGFAQGRTWLASFVANGPLDLNPAVGQFDLDISALNLTTSTLITAAASYSADPVGAHNARAHTGPFATPITLQPAPRLSATQSGNNLLLSWPASQGLFTIQSTPGLAPPVWSNLQPQPPIQQVGADYQAILPLTSSRGFFRLAR
jgi:hypothetical protein